MNRSILVLLVAVVGLSIVAGTADAFEGRLFGRSNTWMAPQAFSWQGGYYDPAWGCPVSVVVPPNAEFQTNYGWGVGNTRVTRINPQFRRGFPGMFGGAGRGLRPAPAAPSDTTQMGSYYIRGPW